jgi:hypothetical protein
METLWNAEMLLSTGSAAASVEKAISAVKDVLCQPQGSSKDVYAIIIRAKHRSDEHPDHLSTMYAVISAAMRSWHEVAKNSNLRRTGIELAEDRQHRGCRA